MTTTAPSRDDSRARIPRAGLSGDSGFGLIEIVVSILLLGLLIISFLPLLVEAMRVSVRNTTVAVATQLASQQLDRIASAPRTCAGYAAAVTAGSTPVADRLGTFRVVTTGTCPTTGLPQEFPVTVTVTVDGNSKLRVRTVTTKIIDTGSTP